MDAASPADGKNTPSPTLASEQLTSSSSSPPDAGAETTTSHRAKKEVDDEQVERFYALLANIRALRGAFGTATVTGKRKRAPGSGRGEEPPWRPKFRLEDFEPEEVCSRAGADAARSEQKGTCDCARRMLAGSETGAVEDDDCGDAVERNGPGGDAARRCALP